MIKLKENYLYYYDSDSISDFERLYDKALNVSNYVYEHLELAFFETAHRSNFCPKQFDTIQSLSQENLLINKHND
jgi:hypothetical protein